MIFVVIPFLAALISALVIAWKELEERKLLMGVDQESGMRGGRPKVWYTLRPQDEATIVFPAGFYADAWVITLRVLEVLEVKTAEIGPPMVGPSPGTPLISTSKTSKTSKSRSKRGTPVFEMSKSMSEFKVCYNCFMLEDKGLLASSKPSRDNVYSLISESKIENLTKIVLGSEKSSQIAAKLKEEAETFFSSISSLPAEAPIAITPEDWFDQDELDRDLTSLTEPAEALFKTPLKLKGAAKEALRPVKEDAGTASK